MNRKKLIKIVVFFLLNSILILATSRSVKADNCHNYGDYYCETAGGKLGGPGVFIRYNPFAELCSELDRTYYYSCYGTDTNCWGGVTYYRSYADCLSETHPYYAGCCNRGSPPAPPCNPSTNCSCSPLSDTETTYGSKTVECDNGCGGTASSTCWCTSACTPDPCPTGTTETNTGDYYDGYSCTNACNQSQNRNCYCTICTPPTCSSIGYNDTNLGYGQVPNEKTPSCRNGQGAPDQLLRCDKTYRKCYCYSCLKQCPTPLSNTGDAKLILNDFRECTNDCSVKPPEDQDDCYEEESPQPTESLSITVNPPDYTNHYGFFSNTHTGDRLSDVSKLETLNDPFEPHLTMTASYTDSNGANDIEGLFVWFRGSQYTGELGTPLYISNSAAPKASAKDSWGFMLRRNGSNWQPYVPSYNGSNVFWTSKDINNNDKVFSIKGTNGEQMVEVTITSGPIEDGNTVSIDFSLRFSDSNGDLFPGNVSEGLYKIYLMGLDKFSFTPYDNYGINYENYWSEGFKYHGYENLSPFWQENQLRYKAEQNQLYARDWTDTGKTWTIDRTKPVLSTSLSVSENSITLSWEASDKINVNNNGNLYSIVGNIFTPDPEGKSISVSTSTPNVSLHNPVDFTINSASYGVSEEKIGILNDLNFSLFQVNPNINSSSNSGSVTLNINQAQGSLLFYITVFDDAGNIVQSEEIKQDLNDWMATSGGLAYSDKGASFTVKDLEGGVWNNILPPSGYGNNPGLLPTNADYTSEMWAENSASPVFLVHHTLLHNYSSNKFTGLDIQGGYYTLLMDAYEKNKKNLRDTVRETTGLGNLAGTVSNYCDKEYCVFKYTEDVAVNSNFACNRKTLMFIQGNLIINPPLKNTTGTDELNGINGCIFVVKGDVNIAEGSNVSGASLKYDKVNGYIFADGQIIIKDEILKRPNTNPIIDGVYVNGGLQSSYSNNKSILFERYLRLEDRLKFPLLVIDLHPKYGVLGEKFFGKEYIIQSVELGVKP